MLSYSSVLPYEKASLPSVEMWNTNMNIVKDPPKGIFTRRIDKVGDTQQILMQQDDSGARVNEFINVYARNVNPMVGVSYNNYGNTNSGRKKQASLPYKVQTVRPPILSQYDLQPLSRLPRDWFYAFTNPHFPNLVQNLQCNEVKKSIDMNNLRTKIRDVMSNKTSIRNTLSEQNHDLNNISKIKNKVSLLQNPMKTNLCSNQCYGNLINKDLKSIKLSPLHALNIKSSKQSLNPKINSINKKLCSKPKKTMTFTSNIYVPEQKHNSQHNVLSFPLSQKKVISDINTRKSYSLTNNINTSLKNLQKNIPNYEITNTKTSLIRENFRSEIMPKLNLKTPHYDVTSIKTSNTRENIRPQTTLILDRNLPMTNVSTQKLFNFERFETHTNRNKHLQDRLHIGGFDNPGLSIPNPQGIQDHPVNGMAIDKDNSKQHLRSEMQKYFRV